MRTRRVTKWCIECLQDGAKTTDQIREFINNKSSHGTTGHGLANVLAKDRRFEKVGEAYISRGTGKYKVTRWALNAAYAFEITENKKKKEQIEVI